MVGNCIMAMQHLHMCFCCWKYGTGNNNNIVSLIKTMKTHYWIGNKACAYTRALFMNDLLLFASNKGVHWNWEVGKLASVCVYKQVKSATVRLYILFQNNRTQHNCRTKIFGKKDATKTLLSHASIRLIKQEKKQQPEWNYEFQTRKKLCLLDANDTVTGAHKPWNILYI